MRAYVIRRLLLLVPTLVGIVLANFAIIQFAPGGPVERAMAELQAADAGAVGDGAASAELDATLRAELAQRFGFDRPWWERLGRLLGDLVTFDLGRSWVHDRPVADLILERLPVSISLGLWSTLITYLVCVPLGIAKAVRDGSPFDVATSFLVLLGYAIPSFAFAILLIVLFAGGTYLDWFPLRGLVADTWRELPWWQVVASYLWHMVLPVAALVVNNFAVLTFLTKNNFLEQLSQTYVLTARAKGLTERQVLVGHVFRNAMLVVLAGLPAALIGVLFTGALLIEVIFSLEGLGLLAYQAVLDRNYPVIFGSLWVFSLTALLVGLVSDLTLRLIDPRIDFEARA